MAQIEFFRGMLSADLRTNLIIGSVAVLFIIILYFILTSGRFKAYFEQRREEKLRQRLRIKLASLEQRESIKQSADR